jgi:hypothetical protein
MLAVFVVALGFGVKANWKYLQVLRLARQLNAAQSPDQAAKVCREILDLRTDFARDTVAEYAAKSPLRAFDRDHAVGIILDDSDGKMYTLRAPKRNGLTTVSTSMGKPPIIWGRVTRLSQASPAPPGEPDRVDFVLESKDNSRTIVEQFIFNGEELEGIATYDRRLRRCSN